MITLWHIMNYQSMEDSIKVLALCKRLYFFFLEVWSTFWWKKNNLGETLMGDSQGIRSYIARELFFLWKCCFSVLMYSTVPPCVCGLKHDSTQTCDSPEPLSMLLFFFQILIRFWWQIILWIYSNPDNFGFCQFFCVWKINVFTRQ